MRLTAYKFDKRTCAYAGSEPVLPHVSHDRLIYELPPCSTLVEPPLTDYGNGHLAACHHPLNVDKETLARVQVSKRHTPETADESARPQEPGAETARPIPE